MLLIFIKFNNTNNRTFSCPILDIHSFFAWLLKQQDISHSRACLAASLLICVRFFLNDQTTSADFSVHMFLDIRSTFCFIFSYRRWTLRGKYAFCFAGEDAPFRGETFYISFSFCLLNIRLSLIFVQI